MLSVGERAINTSRSGPWCWAIIRSVKTSVITVRAVSKSVQSGQSVWVVNNSGGKTLSVEVVSGNGQKQRSVGASGQHGARRGVGFRWRAFVNVGARQVDAVRGSGLSVSRSGQ